MVTALHPGRTSGDSEQLIAVLYDLHAFFNETFFDVWETPLPRPVFTISAEGRTRLGHFWPGKWYATESEKAEELAAALGRGATGARIIRTLDTKPDEINLHSEQGLNRTFDEVAATVCHEMCHQAQHHYPAVYGKAGKNNHHNMKWHALAARCFLDTSGPKGYTKITDDFRRLMLTFERPSDWVARLPGSKTKQTTRMLLWECGCETPMKVRCAKELHATCDDCGSEFERR